MSLIKKIVRELRLTLEWVCMGLPNSFVGNRLRMLYWRTRLGNDAVRFVGRGAEVVGVELLELGPGFVLGEHAALHIGESDPVYIGSDVGMGRGVFVRSANHRIDEIGTSYMHQGHASKQVEFGGKRYSIVVEDDVWVGAHAILLTGTHLGKGSVVSAGSVVASAVPAYSIVAGNPARVIANRVKLAEMQKG